jgi:hypothetical protein
MEALRHPGELARNIVPWVLVARALRLTALGCFIAAVGLPVTIAGMLLLMAIQGGVGSTGPASTAVRLAVITASLPAVIGVDHVSMATAATLIGATQGATMVVNLTISIVVLGVTLRTASPKRLWGYCRREAAAAVAKP